MSTSADCPLAAVLAQRLRHESTELVERWLERIMARVNLRSEQVFPTDEILDHVPLLIVGIADYLEDPVEEITADIPVVAKAMELGELRHAQGFDAYEILKEYEVLGGVLFEFLIRRVDEIDEPCTRGELLVCGHRLFRAVSVVQQFTTTHFLHRADQRVKEREDRLRRFNGTVAHELKGRMGALLAASALLEAEGLSGSFDASGRGLSMIKSNVVAMDLTLVGLLELSSIEAVDEWRGNICLPEAAAEVKRQLREFAEAREVRVELADDLPDVEVPAAAVELVLSNFISNAIKYRNPAESDRWVRVQGSVRQQDGNQRELEVVVHDNGLGVPESARERLFEPFFRAHKSATGEEGSGLGLSLVKDTVDDLGGRAWARFGAAGSQFGFTLPLPRNAP